MKNSHIEWTDHTFNPWIGCTKVSPGCENCYAEARDQRFAQGKHWGKGAPRQRTSMANWRQPLLWAKDAETMECFGPHRPRVFCASLADWLDDEVPIEWLADLLKLIQDTPKLDWLLLTKRSGNWRSRLTEVRYFLNDVPDSNPWFFWLVDWLEGKFPSNVWIGTTAEDQARAEERIPQLLEIPARVRFLSCEPLLEKITFPSHTLGQSANCPQCGTLKVVDEDGLCPMCGMDAMVYGVDWVICGGESGPNARPLHPAWARSLRDQCQAAGVPFFFKQWGEYAPGCTDYGDHGHEFLPQEDDVPGRMGERKFAGSKLAQIEGQEFLKVGKHVAGRLLDGREWSEFPKVEVAA